MYVCFIPNKDNVINNVYFNVALGQ